MRGGEEKTGPTRGLRGIVGPVLSQKEALISTTFLKRASPLADERTVWGNSLNGPTVYVSVSLSLFKNTNMRDILPN